jgi:hypothetical protein
MPASMAARVCHAQPVIVEARRRERRPVRLVALLVLSLRLCVCALGQTAEKAKVTDPLNRDSPQSSVLFFSGGVSRSQLC